MCLKFAGKAVKQGYWGCSNAFLVTLDKRPVFSNCFTDHSDPIMISWWEREPLWSNNLEK